MMNSSIMDEFGFRLSILALFSNILFFGYFYQYEKKFDNFEQSMIHKLPWEYRKKSSSKIIRYLKIHLGRSGYRAVIAIFFILWCLAAYYSHEWTLKSTNIEEDSIQQIDDLKPSDFLDLKDYKANSGSVRIDGDFLTWNPSKDIRVSLTIPKLWNSSNIAMG